MANRFIGGVLSSRPQANTPFSSRASTGTYFDSTGTLVTAPVNQPRLNRNFTGSLPSNRYSALFTSASTNYLSTVTAASALGTGNFTMEFWWKANSTTQSNYSNIINQGFTGSPSNGAFSFKVYSTSNILNFTYYNGGISDNSTTANVNDLAWHHIAASRNGTSLGIYVDGALNTTITLPASFNMGASGGTTYIGYNPRDASYINGHVKDLRLITGQALYSGTFTPPTAPLTTTTVGSTGAGAAATLSGTVILLTCQTASLNDVSSNNYTITNTNVVTSSTLLPSQLGIDTSGTGWSQPSVLIEPASTNIVSYSQDFSQVAYWTLNNNTVGSAASTAPDGTNTAFKIQENTSNNVHGVEQQLGDTNGRAYTLSIFAKAAERSWLILDNTHQGVANYRNWFNLSTGVTGTKESGNIHTSMVPVGNGWYRCSVTRPAGTLGSHRICIYASTGDGTTTYTGTSGYGILIWGCQLEYQLGMTSYISSPSTGVGTRAADIVGPGTSGIYSLEDRQTSTAVDDQATVQTFTSTGSYSWTAPADVVSVEVLVVAGGGGGSENTAGGGGGAGGVIYNSSYPVTPGTTYTVTVGAGGATTSNGQNSNFANIIAVGGGTGGDYGNPTGTAGRSGGSGGGGGFCQTTAPSLGGSGISTQGNAGGTGSTIGTGGGGGAGSVGSNATGTGGGRGGAGLAFNISGTSTYYGGGGGGGAEASGTSGVASGGVGGGGNGAYRPSATVATSGTANTGGGGGGCYNLAHPSAGAGGSGIVVIKYKRTPRQITSTSNAAVVVQKFSTTNLWTVPAGVTSVEALVVAGGGGGANIFGGGGAGGVVYNSALAVTPGSTYTIGVGTGGLGGAAATNTPNNGRNGFGSGIGTGTELITNGSNFTVTTGWSATTATLSVPQTGTFRILPNASVNGTASQSITTVNGVTYVAVVKVINDVTKNFRLLIGTTQVGSEITDFFTSYTRDSLDNGLSGAGFYSVTFTATGSTTWINMQIGGGTQQATDISYISVRQATLPTVGGGFGGAQAVGNAGGSGGGGGDWSAGAYAGGAGTAGQGNAGGAGAGVDGHGGGGGGAGSAGVKGITNLGGQGGTGIAYSISGNLEYYGGGGGGGVYTGVYTTAVAAQGGLGGGGAGGRNTGSSGGNSGNAGSSNTGGGGGGGTRTSQSVAGGNGGSGVVILRYRVPQVVTFLDTGAWTCPSGVTSVQALIVAGGGGGGAGSTGSQLGGGGGGAGGVIYDNSIPVTPGQTYSVVVGQGGIGGVTLTSVGSNGQNSSFANLIAIGGGYGALRQFSENGSAGGSGGGGAGGAGAVGGSGTYGQGNSGATTAGGGGGAGSPGVFGQSSTEPTGGAGGAGLQFSISGTATYYAGGGASGAWGGATINPGSLGGGGSGGPSRSNGFVGAQNTGGGGGGSGSGYRNSSLDTAATGNGAHGGSGVVILRWVGA